MTDAEERELEIAIRIIDIDITLARRHEERAAQANRRRRRQVWSREWLNRRTIFGQYETLLQELNREDPRGFE